VKKIRSAAAPLLGVLLSLVGAMAGAAEVVTVDNFVRADTDMTLDRYVK